MTHVDDSKSIRAIEDLGSLFKKLEKANFTRELRLRFESGDVASAELRHSLAFREFRKPLLVIENESSLKP